MRRAVLAAALSAWSAAAPLQAADIDWSAFGTIGYARTDRSYVYERFLDSKGTMKRDSLLGLQGTLGLSPRWSLTVQARLAPSISFDNRWEATLPWAFVSYRAANDLLLRAGKLRMPMYLFSENMDVGASYAVLRMPTEVYSTAPTTDFTGASFSKTWYADLGDLVLDGYAGHTRLTPRGGAFDLHTHSTGLVLSLHRDDDTYRFGVQRALIGIDKAGMASGTAADFGAAPPDAPAASEPLGGGHDYDTRVYLLGADVGICRNLRLISEYARRHAVNAVTPKNSQGAYVTLAYTAGDWTPYATVARLMTDQAARQESSAFDDQDSLAAGLSYLVTPTSRLKAEWMRVRFGADSSMIDGGGAGARPMNVFSLTYSFSR